MSPMSLLPPEKPKDEPKIESGAGLPEGQPKEDIVKWLKVFCSKCRALPGQPCWEPETHCPKCQWTISKARSPWMIHIARVMLYEAYALGDVNELGLPISGDKIKPPVSRE